MVTATAGLETGQVQPETAFDDTGTYVVYGGKVTNYGGEIFGGHDFTQALTLSVNTTFARVGVLVGQEQMIATMEGFGFYQRAAARVCPRARSLASGRYEGGRLLPTDAPMDPLAVAWMSIGQEQLLATPLQMALVAAAVANGGGVAQPYLVQERQGPPTARSSSSAAPTTWTTAMDPATAATLKTMMQQVVNAGTGTAAALQGIQVAGKTGTAEKGDSNVAWFIAFAPADVASGRGGGDHRRHGPRPAETWRRRWRRDVISAALAQTDLPWTRPFLWYRDPGEMDRQMTDRLEQGELVVGRYRVLSTLGAGGMADVYLAEDLKLGRKVALKVLLRRYASDAQFVERFRREAQAAAQINHPNIVGIYDWGAIGETYYIVMEYVQGETLKDHIRRGGRFRRRDASTIALGLLARSRPPTRPGSSTATSSPRTSFSTPAAP